MKISEQINQIIEARHRHLPGIDSKLKKLSDIEEVLQQLDYMKSQMISQDGEIIQGGKYASLMAQNPDMAWNLQATDTGSTHKALMNARVVLEDCRHRFARESISVSVIGEARRGKSALLKSISGLDDLVIPAFESTDCTGAPSIIYNDENQQLKATLTFKSRRQMMDMAQVYLDKLIPDPMAQIHISSMEQIRSLDMNDILKKVPVGHPGLIVQSYLKKLIDHYDEWAVFAGRTEPLVLNNKNEIATFVAQNNGVPVGDEKRIEYYRYLVVERCEIQCAFPEVEVGKINLVDTVGLGDHTEGILEGMLHTVEKESDAVVFMILPQNGAGGGIPQSVVEIYRQIVDNCNDRDLSKWLFYMINHVEHTKGSYAQNTQYCASAAKMLKESKFLGCEHTKIINALDARAVREDFLLPMLIELSKNLESIDQIYIDKVNEALKSLHIEYSQLAKKAQKVLNSDFSHNVTLTPIINKKTKASFEQMRGSLFRLLAKWEEKKNQPCAIIFDATEKILSRMQQDYMKDTYVPSREDILLQLETGTQPPQVYMDYENKIRNAVAKDFLSVNIELQELVDDIKDQVAEVFCNQNGFNAILKPDNSRPIHEWLRDFSETVLDENSYPNIKLAFDTLYEFDFTVKGFLTYEVRDGLNGLDPSFSNLPAIVNNQGNISKTASRIRTSLLSRLCVIASELNERLEALFCKPNMALFAEVSEFYDRIIYSEGVDVEWRTFYAENAGILWADEIKKIQFTGVLCKDWMDLVDALVSKNSVSNFVL